MTSPKATPHPRVTPSHGGVVGVPAKARSKQRRASASSLAGSPSQRSQCTKRKVSC